MKVRIEDKEALAALSWELLKAYLDRSADWAYSEDIPGKALVYQHTDKTGRLREIVVPIRTDFADYASRMGDAVGTLARVEDRSELDVYDDLSNSPAETACKVHQKIRKWLAEERWGVREVDDPKSVFNVMATLPSGPDVNIFHYKNHIDCITLSQHLHYPDELQAAFDQLLPGDLLRDLVWSIYRDVSMMGIEFSGFDTPSTEMTLRAYVYFDGLTKDAFIQRVLLTVRAVALTIRTFSRALEAQSSAEKLDLSREKRVLSREELRTILRALPRTDGPLTIAG